jgi:molybdopterin-containing oxidoreductase family iron-sulfur binding subunit
MTNDQIAAPSIQGEGRSPDLAALRQDLAGLRGPEFWRSLEELAGSPAFREALQREFPEHASVWVDPVGRREFLKLMGASLALAGLGACTRQPDEKIVPYVRAPEDIVPGKPLFFATAMPLLGFATGVLVESHMGRPTKVEGNPQHPASLGATDAFAQASVLSLYDPDRSQVVTHAGRISTWDAFLGVVSTELEEQRLTRGARLRVLTETVTSPTLAHQLRALLEIYPLAKWHQYEPAGRDAARAGARLAFGRPVHTYYRFDRAEVILALDADFLAGGAGSLRYARDFTARRRAQGGEPPVIRLYAVECTPSITGAMADHRLPLRASHVEGFARLVAQALGIPAAAPAADLSPAQAAWAATVAADLARHRGASAIVAGDQQPAAVHALAHAMNAVLDNVGATVIHTDPVEANPVDQKESLRDLVRDLQAGQVHTLVILGGNPVFTAPADLPFAEALSKARLRIHLSLYEDETSARCDWHIPETHFLESWADARAFDGTVTILQPLIAPLYNGRSAHELLAALLGEPGSASYDILRDYWRSQFPPPQFEALWRTALHDGIVPDTALPPTPARSLRGRGTAVPHPKAPAASPAGLEIVFRPDPTVFDGRFANNGWLQELPKPLTKLTWDNAALISPATAQRLGLSNEDVVELRHEGRSLRAPIWIMPGHAEDSVTVHLGHGRTLAGRVGTGVGFNAYALRTSHAPGFASGLEIRKTGARSPLASTQEQHSMEGRHLVRVGSLEEFRANPAFAQKLGHDPDPRLTLYPSFEYAGAAWGMAIDLNACIGCGACVLACQAENNIPVVGKTEIRRGRAMHWLRIDRYYHGGLDNPETYHQPVLCMHCENAPCEVVCPVAATVHSDEGLNEMVYNRCVGTRYCANNCPYKVRRFNFLQYADYDTPSLKLQRNPNVTVRTRGVMEKCTYCVQRINAARIQAKKEDRPIRDGEVVTACQAACPTQAIVFGNINDPNSRVAALKAEPRNYGLLVELNTRPRTSYLARLRNPNPEMGGA